MSEVKQKLVNFKYLYISWWLVPAIQLTLSFVIGFGYIYYFKPDLGSHGVILFLIMLGLCSHLHMGHIIWNTVSKTKNICSLCNKPTKFLRKNEFQCLNPDCSTDLILKEEKH